MRWVLALLCSVIFFIPLAALLVKICQEVNFIGRTLFFPCSDSIYVSDNDEYISLYIYIYIKFKNSLFLLLCVMHYSYHYLCACPFIILTAGFSYIDANVGFPFLFFCEAGRCERRNILFYRCRTCVASR